MFLAPQVDETKDLLKQLVVSHTSLTSAALGAATTFIAPQDPAPDWLGKLQAALAPMQAAAKTWYTETGPQAIEVLPQALVTYNTRFQAAMQSAANGDQAATLQDFEWLKRIAGDPLTTAQTLTSHVTSFATEFTTQRSAIEAAIAGAKSSIQTDRDDILRLQDLISTLYAKISDQYDDLDSTWHDQVVNGASISWTLLEFGYTAAVAGTAEIPFLDIAVALYSITSAAIETALKERDIVDELEQIRDLKVQLSIDEQRIAALQVILDSLERLDFAIVGARDAPSFAPIWEDVSTDLGDAIDELSRPGFDMTTLHTQMQRAASAWQQASDMATNVQKVAAGTGDHQTIDLTTWTPAR